ncbi:hypothetical protein D9M69_649910 [compost metagenome]
MLTAINSLCAEENAPAAVADLLTLAKPDMSSGVALAKAPSRDWASFRRSFTSVIRASSKIQNQIDHILRLIPLRHMTRLSEEVNAN